jgi:DNA-binding CsgD family transcriptional regulator
MVWQGYRNDRIAYRLGVSLRTAAQLASAVKRRANP